MQAIELRILAAELALPAYASMTAEQAAAALNTANVSVQTQRNIIPSREIIEATVAAEWAALTAAEKQRYQTITGAGDVNVLGTNTRAAFAAMFAAGTTTRANLIALQTETKLISRAAQLGIGTVTDHDVTAARIL
jgi:hypothetical protein